MGLRAKQCRDSGRRERDDESGPAADAVRHVTQNEASHHGAGQARGEHGADTRKVQMKIFCDQRRYDDTMNRS